MGLELPDERPLDLNCGMRNEEVGLEFSDAGLLHAAGELAVPLGYLLLAVRAALRCPGCVAGCSPSGLLAVRAALCLFLRQVCWGAAICRDLPPASPWAVPG